MNVVLTLVIHSGICAPCRHLLISNASLSWMEVNFLNQKTSIPSWPGVFHFDIIFSVVLSKSMCISAFGLSSSLSNSFVILFISSADSLSFLLPYINPKSFGFFCIRLLVCFRVIPPLLLTEFSFVVFECPVLSLLFYLCRYLFYLPYFVKLYCYFFLCCIFLFVHTYSRVFPLIYNFGLFSLIFYLRLQSNFPSWFWFFLYASWGDFTLLTN